MDLDKYFNSVRSHNNVKQSNRDTNKSWSTADEIDFLHQVLIRRSTPLWVPELKWIQNYLASMKLREWPSNMDRNAIEKEALWLMTQLKLDMLNEKSARFSPYYAKKTFKQSEGWTLEDLR